MTDPIPQDPPNPPEPRVEPPPEPPKDRDWAAELKAAQAALEAERKLRIKSDNQINNLKQTQMSEAEKAIAAARVEGRSEALREAGKRLAAAEFRAIATGKIGDPAGALELIDLGRFVGDDGEPDTAAIEDAVGKLAAALTANGQRPPVPQAPHVPAGARDQDAGDTDWLRSALKARG